MITFKQYLIETTSGNYVSIQVTDGIVIPGLDKMFGSEHVCTSKDQHVTLIYSVGSHMDENKIQEKCLKFHTKTITAKIINVEAFDSSDKGTCAIVVCVESKQLDQLYKDLKKLGLTHTYSEFKPHISILYNIPIELKQQAIEAVKSGIKVKTVELKTFTNEPVNTTWTDRLK